MGKHRALPAPSHAGPHFAHSVTTLLSDSAWFVGPESVQSGRVMLLWLLRPARVAAMWLCHGPALASLNDPLCILRTPAHTTEPAIAFAKPRTFGIAHRDEAAACRRRRALTTPANSGMIQQNGRWLLPRAHRPEAAASGKRPAWPDRVASCRRAEGPAPHRGRAFPCLPPGLHPECRALGPLSTQRRYSSS